MCTNVDDKDFNVDDMDFQSEAGRNLETWRIVRESTIFDVFSNGTSVFDSISCF